MSRSTGRPWQQRSDVSDFRGQAIVITGGAGGLGREIALLVAARGAAVGILDLHVPDAGVSGVTPGGIMAELDDLGARSLGHSVDVTDESAVRRAVATLEGELGPITGLVTAAGGRMVQTDGSTPRLGPEADQRASAIEMERARRVFDVNVLGTMITVKAVVPGMVAAGQGRIVTVASVNGLHSRPFGTHADYAAAKAAVVQYTRYLAADVGRHGITANCIAPGLTLTEKSRDRYEGKPELTRHMALDRLSTPADQAKAVAFLLSEAADYITGATLEVSGGTRVAWWGPEPPDA